MFSGRPGGIGFSSSATMGGTLRARIGTVAGYDTTDTAEVEVLVVTAPAWLVSLDPTTLLLTEGGGTQYITVVYRATLQ